jgi:hypothetical protein
MNYKTIRHEAGMVLTNARTIFNNIVTWFRYFVFQFQGLVTSAFIDCKSQISNPYQHVPVKYYNDKILSATVVLSAASVKMNIDFNPEKHLSYEN